MFNNSNIYVLQLQSPTVENKVELRVLLPDRNISTVKVSKNSNAEEVYQVTLSFGAGSP